jgi:hypothetical protein
MALVAGGLLMGVLPELQSATLAAALRFENRAGYAKRVLEGVPLVARASFGGKPFDALDGIVAMGAGVALAARIPVVGARPASLRRTRDTLANRAQSTHRPCWRLRDMVDTWSSDVWLTWNAVPALVSHHYRRQNVLDAGLLLCSRHSLTAQFGKTGEQFLPK